MAGMIQSNSLGALRTRSVFHIYVYIYIYMFVSGIDSTNNIMFMYRNNFHVNRVGVTCSTASDAPPTFGSRCQGREKES